MRIKLFYLLSFILFFSLFLSACSNSPGKYDAFATCLFEKGATMYGTEWCSHCQNQKKTFGKSFKYVDYVDCDKDRDECLRNGVKGYPTWIINGEKYSGEQSLQRLASLTDCSTTSQQSEPSGVCDIEKGCNSTNENTQ